MRAIANNVCRFTPDDEVMPGVRFGLSGWAGSPAFWSKLAEFEEEDPEDYISPKGTRLADDLAFCLLGGYGVKMELNRAAWEHLYDAGVFRADPVPSRNEIEALLSTPLQVNGRPHKYRYPKQRADRLHTALNAIRERPPDALAGLRVGASLAVILHSTSGFSVAVCVRPDATVVGSLSAFRSLTQLLECLEHGIAYRVEVTEISSGRCHVRGGRVR